MTHLPTDHEHYYNVHPTASRAPVRFTARLLGNDLTFVSDTGVFSRGRIDPGSRLLIERAPLPEKGAILDLGAGYGAVGIAVAKARPDLCLHLVEQNQRAAALAEANARQNGVENVQVYRGDGFSAEGLPPHFAAILTNPPYRAGKKLVYAWVDQSFERLCPGGELICVGRTKQGVASLKAHMQSVFGNVRDIAKGGGYRVIASTRR